jgi:hypothetical protein
MIHTNLSDKELYAPCKRFGEQTLHWRHKFAGLLPEVLRRERSTNEKGQSWLKKRGFTCL